MKRIILSVAMLTAICCFSLNAQVNTEPGELQGGNASDTAHYRDDRSKHVHEQTTVLEKKTAGQQKAVNAGNDNVQSGNPPQPDTNATAANNSGSVLSVDSSQNTGSNSATTNNSDNPCYSSGTVYVLGGLLGLAVLMILLLLFRRRKDAGQ